WRSARPGGEAPVSGVRVVGAGGGWRRDGGGLRRGEVRRPQDAAYPQCDRQRDDEPGDRQPVAPPRRAIRWGGQHRPAWILLHRVSLSSERGAPSRRTAPSL